MAGLLIVVQVEGCYYMQAIRGHADLMSRRRPVDEVIADERSPEALKSRLELVTEARDFAVAELMLPDNKSYRSYADLERDYVVWNVFAAPEFSLEPKTWCFPVAGCVAYRGYFKEKSAQAFAQRLSGSGFDVAVGGVSAYSTLGKFADPVLNTMMRWSDVDLVTTMFHELAHQKLYVKGDSAFNESFATAVADFGVQRWLRATGVLDQSHKIDRDDPTRKAMLMLATDAREELARLYDEDLDDDVKRARKNDILSALSNDAEELVQSSGGNVRNWLAPPLNNARLVSLNLYEGGFNAFRSILDSCAGDLSCFYARAEALAELTAEERAVALAASGD